MQKFQHIRFDWLRNILWEIIPYIRGRIVYGLYSSKYRDSGGGLSPENEKDWLKNLSKENRAKAEEALKLYKDALIC